MHNDELWELERRFWLGGVETYETHMDPQCLMAFPAPAGLLAGPAIVEALRQAPRWAQVELSDQRLARPAPDMAVLAYRARGSRGDGDVYQAYCTSTYRRAGGTWRLAQHQQTPA